VIIIMSEEEVSNVNPEALKYMKKATYYFTRVVGILAHGQPAVAAKPAKAKSAAAPGAKPTKQTKIAPAAAAAAPAAEEDDDAAPASGAKWTCPCHLFRGEGVACPNPTSPQDKSQTKVSVDGKNHNVPLSTACRKELLKARNANKPKRERPAKEKTAAAGTPQKKAKNTPAPAPVAVVQEDDNEGEEEVEMYEEGAGDEDDLLG
jgi:hypothetical protein